MNPEWVTAVATALALVAAGVAAIFAGRHVRIEAERDARATAHDRQSQASLVSAWWSTHQVSSTKPRARAWGLAVQNASNAPVFAVEIEVGVPSTPKPDNLELHVLPPGTYFIRLQRRRGDDEPDGWGLAQSEHTIANGLNPVLRDEQYSVVSLRFLDSAGAGWCRDRRGLLHADDGAARNPE